MKKEVYVVSGKEEIRLSRVVKFLSEVPERIGKEMRLCVLCTGKIRSEGQ